MSAPFPSPLITERLIIRAPNVEDAGQLQEAILDTWDELTPWMPWAVNRPSLAESRETCARMARGHQECRDFAVFCFDRLTGRFIMASGAHPRKPEVPSYEIGYWCRTGCQGQRYVTEAVRAITRACFEVMGARRIEIRCDPRNAASRLVAERCGYLLEGDCTNDSRDTSGNLRSTLVFAQSRNHE